MKLNRSGRVVKPNFFFGRIHFKKKKGKVKGRTENEIPGLLIFVLLAQGSDW